MQDVDNGNFVQKCVVMYKYFTLKVMTIFDCSFLNMVSKILAFIGYIYNFNNFNTLLTID